MLDMKLPRDMRIFLNEMKNADDLYIEDNDILVSRSGTVGTSTMCGASYRGCVASDDCIRLRCDIEHVGFVAAYMKTKIGLTLLAKDSHGKVIKHLKPEDVENLKIPQFDKATIRKVNDIMLSAKDAFDLTRHSYEQVEVMLEKYLGKLVPPQFLNCSVVPFGSLKLTRLDPHMYDPYSNFVTHEIIRSKMFMGYDKDENGKLIINKEQAKIVKRIYKLFEEGYNCSQISNILKREGVKGTKADTWPSSAIKAMLQNEKYYGDTLM